ncbi:hypothetical protein ACXZ65_37965 [Streptomyces aculeolatus]
MATLLPCHLVPHGLADESTADNPVVQTAPHTPGAGRVTRCALPLN